MFQFSSKNFTDDDNVPGVSDEWLTTEEINNRNRRIRIPTGRRLVRIILDERRATRISQQDGDRPTVEEEKTQEENDEISRAGGDINEDEFPINDQEDSVSEGESLLESIDERTEARERLYWDVNPKPVLSPRFSDHVPEGARRNPQRRW